MKTEQLNPAQLADKLLNRTALGVAIVCSAYVLSVIEYFLNGLALTLAGYLQLGLTALVLIVLFPTFYNFIKMRTSNKQACSEVEGFLSNAFNRAAATSFRWTFIFLLVVEMTIKRSSLDFPTPFYIEVILAFTLGIFALTFYLLIREDNNFELDSDTEENNS